MCWGIISWNKLGRNIEGYKEDGRIFYLLLILRTCTLCLILVIHGSVVQLECRQVWKELWWAPRDSLGKTHHTSRSHTILLLPRLLSWIIAIFFFIWPIERLRDSSLLRAIVRAAYFHLNSSSLQPSKQTLATVVSIHAEVELKSSWMIDMWKAELY